MKKCFKYLLTAILGAGLMTACSPEEFEGVSEAGVPQASAFENLVDIAVDQEFNQITLNLKDAKGYYPIWTIECPDGTIEKPNSNGFQKIYNFAGDYHITCQIGNRNGISDGVIERTVHLNNSIISWDSYLGRISKSAWHIANKEKAHLACGPGADDPTSWWSAGEDEKKDFGVYDNELTFGADYTYTFNPGDAKSIYVNWGVTSNGWQDTYWSGKENDDFNVPVEETQVTTYKFEARGNDVYVVFPKGTYFPYIAHDDIWNEPAYKLVNLTTKKMTLQIDMPGISWQYILTTENTVTKEFKGFTYDQPDNIWKNIEVNAGGIYYADGGWAPYPDNGGATFNVTNQEANVVLPLATVSQWQAQFPIVTNVGPGSANMTSAKKYDFSCVITSNKDLKGMTLKLVETGDNGVPGSLGIAYDANAVFYDNSTNLKAYEDYVFYLVEQPGVDIQDNLLQLVMDFGGCEEGTEVTVKNIVLIEHDKNTELDKLPGNDPGTDGPAAGTVIWADVNSPANLMTAGELTLASTWFANDNWTEISQPAVEINGRNALVTISEANGGSQWQGQVHLNTKVAIEEGKAYDFAIVLAPSQSIGGATVKPHPEGDDGHFFSEGRHDLNGFEDNRVTYENFVADFSTENLVITLDFPGCAAGTTIEVKDIIIQEHNEVAAGGDSWADVNSADNLMNSGALALASTWVANDGWAELANQPTVDITGNNALITFLEANGGSQWQGQVHFNTGVAIEEGVTYDFAIVLTPSQDIAGATVKPHPEGDDGHFFSEGRHDLVAYEDNKVTYTEFTADFSTSNLVITLDFPSCAAGTTIEVKDIIIQKHKASAGNLPNLMDNGTLELASTWFATDGWAELGNQPTVDITGNNAMITVNEANGGSQWQGQVHLNTGVAIAEGKTYNFAITLTPSQEIGGATVKPHPVGDDGHFFSEGRHDLASYEENVVTYKGFVSDFSTENLVITLDFPSCAAGTTIEVTNIVIQEY